MIALRLGTRGSALARTQSGLVAAALTAVTGRQVELVVIRAEGDDVTIPLDAPPRPGAFVATLRDALLAGEVDLVVHSFKDLPSAPLAGLVGAAVAVRGAISEPRQSARPANREREVGVFFMRRGGSSVGRSGRITSCLEGLR